MGDHGPGSRYATADVLVDFSKDFFWEGRGNICFCQGKFACYLYVSGYIQCPVLDQALSVKFDALQIQGKFAILYETLHEATWGRERRARHSCFQRIYKDIGECNQPISPGVIATANSSCI